MPCSVSPPVDAHKALGARIRGLRIAAGLSIEVTAERAGLAEKSVRNLETGKGSTTETLLRVLDVLSARDTLAALLGQAEAANQN